MSFILRQSENSLQIAVSTENTRFIPPRTPRGSCVPDYLRLEHHVRLVTSLGSDLKTVDIFSPHWELYSEREVESPMKGGGGVRKGPW